MEDGQDRGMEKERSQMHINLDEDTEALKLGIEKAEIRLAERKAEQMRSNMEAKWTAARLEGEKDHDEMVGGEKEKKMMEGYRIPKRARPVVVEEEEDREEEQPSSKKFKIAHSGPGHQPHISIRPHILTTTAGPRAHGHQHTDAGVYGRRDY
ncbi:hypothetical protein N0V83_009064 [Neocucurbitaria cava]|uniref:Uncharacterized protein n=1 Tax=Neocucurbitaria cava TaxID=798079 RepID=A0A9W9CIL9_9PLEO|nr:hypothetical protein N0V83_009064 [Neocucurbitaria cava]